MGNYGLNNNDDYDDESPEKYNKREIHDHMRRTCPARSQTSSRTKQIPLFQVNLFYGAGLTALPTIQL